MANPRADSTAKLALGTGVALVIAAIVIFVSFQIGNKKRASIPSWQQRDAEMNVLDSQLKALTARIKSLQGQSRCQSDSDCKVVGLGVKTCGGFNNFLVYSTRDADEPALLEVVQEFNSTFDKFVSLSLKVPPCGVQPARIRCVDNACQSP